MEQNVTFHPLNQATPAISVFGQTWHFTGPAISALNCFGLGSLRSLKALIITTGTFPGMTEGIHEIYYLGVNLQLLVKGDQVFVVDPYS